MAKKPYQTPQLQTLGSVEELTRRPDLGTIGSVDLCESFDKADQSTVVICPES